MPTRATIVCKLQDGQYGVNYLHFDGDLAGETLKKFFNDQQKAEALATGFNLRSINQDGTVERYDDSKGKIVRTAREVIKYISGCSADYVYVFENGKWKAGFSHDI